MDEFGTCMSIVDTIGGDGFIHLRILMGIWVYQLWIWQLLGGDGECGKKLVGLSK